MKTLITALMAVSALAAAPAMAQDDHGGRRDRDDRYERGDDRDGRGYDRSDDRIDGRHGQVYGADLRARYERISAAIARGQRNGRISYREADRLNQQLRALRMVDRQYRHSGGRLTRAEQRELEHRADRLERQVRMERRDGDNRRR